MISDRDNALVKTDLLPCGMVARDGTGDGIVASVERDQMT